MVGGIALFAAVRPGRGWSWLQRGLLAWPAVRKLGRAWLAPEDVRRIGADQMRLTQSSTTRLSPRAMAMMGLVAWLLTGCAATNQLHTTTQSQAIDLEPQILKTTGIAFITPSSVTGQEEDRQALALAFTEALKLSRPELRVVSLPETLGAINRAGLAGEYRQMFEDYRLTGIFTRETLLKVSRVTGARYLAQLKLGGFRQESKNRWGAMGIRMLETKTTSLRLYLQIWDGETGSVAWEGAQELISSHESLKEDSISFKMAVEQSATALLERLP